MCAPRRIRYFASRPNKLKFILAQTVAPQCMSASMSPAWTTNERTLNALICDTLCKLFRVTNWSSRFESGEPRNSESRSFRAHILPCNESGSIFDRTALLIDRESTRSAWKRSSVQPGLFPRAFPAFASRDIKLQAFFFLNSVTTGRQGCDRAVEHVEHLTFPAAPLLFLAATSWTNH